MTLAVIFLLSTLGIAPTSANHADPINSGPLSLAQPGNSAQAAATQSPPPANSSSGAPVSTPGSASQSSANPIPKKPRHKKPVSTDCTPADPSDKNQQSVNAGADSAQPAASVDTKKAIPAAKNCPPSKIIVRQGGTGEPAIQLAGGPAGDEAVQKRNAVNQMLGSTDANLKKLAGRTLSPAEQDTVNQIQQYSHQSQEALDAGDLERARTLAWKAQTLSADLVNPKQ